jgi:hypothetical protein
MGAGVVEGGGDLICAGDDVLGALNAIFADPTCDAFKKAQAHKDKFKNIKLDDKENYKALIKAYEAVGLTVDSGWRLFLKNLGRAQPQGPQNIFDIAQIRYHGLDEGVIMLTSVHVPVDGGHVQTVRGTPAGLHSTINSPCPMPEPSA